ncbi:MAG: FIST N-terminal domain-containing protein [Planctomycetota bacterium]|nr:FIST N-terminal domain-containing protein [Planctomycetota bacterium]
MSDCSDSLGTNADLVLAFAGRPCCEEPAELHKLFGRYPHASFLGCSAAGEIAGTRVRDDSISAVAVAFERSQARFACAHLDEGEDGFETGVSLGKQLEHDGLVHVLVLSDGLHVNGTALARGLNASLPSHVTVTGGLAGDGDRFDETYLICGRELERRAVAVVGLYGDHLHVGHGSLGGWDPFGPERVITKSSGNVLYALDGRSALELYKLYLGEHASGLPATGLLFPLAIRTHGQSNSVVRTILSVDEKEQSLTFAGDVPEGSYARLMRANFDRLIDGALAAAKLSRRGHEDVPPALALLVSCVGRKMVLKQRIEEEVEAVRDVLGSEAMLTGFYSYGEISPLVPEASCELHNQTMTITTLAEM